MIASTKEAKCFAIQLENDITGKAELLTVIRLVCKEDIIEQVLLCKLLTKQQQARLLQGFTALAKKGTLSLFSSAVFAEREILISKLFVPELQKV